jgi:shikimate 5-dehydrogenase
MLFASESGSLMPPVAEVTARLLGVDDVELKIQADVGYGGLPNILRTTEFRLAMLGYPHVDQAPLFATDGNVTDAVKLTCGANVLLRSSLGCQADDTRPEGLVQAMHHWKLQPFQRALIIGAKSPAYAAALACERFGAEEIHILNNSGPAGIPQENWKWKSRPDGTYDIVVNAMRWPPCDIGPAELFPATVDETIFIDVVYNPSETPFIVAARDAGYENVYTGVLPAVFRTAMAVHRACERDFSANEEFFAVLSSVNHPALRAA